MDVIIISIGSELTYGQTVDTNSAWLSQRLADVGGHVQMHLTVADELEPVEREIRRACDLADVVLITGGLGPTEDDLTRQALAAVMGVRLELDESFLGQVKSFFVQRNIPMPDANAVQAMFPVGSTPIENTCGTAPGIKAVHRRATIYVMPGVPREMRVMYERSVLPELQARSAGAVRLARTLLTFGGGESYIAEQIRDLMARGRNPSVGTTAQQMVIGIRIHAAGATREQAQALLDSTADDITSRLGSMIFGQDDDTLWSVVTRLLIDKSKTVSTAESCTGGLIAKCLTDTSGSSGSFVDGVVTYSNAAKARLLQVPAVLIAGHGAVSHQVAEAMAVNCRRLSGTDYAISTTGIAGPTGGSDEKPVGLVYVALADANGCEVNELRIGSFLAREEIRERACKAAINMLRKRLLES